MYLSNSVLWQFRFQQPILVASGHTTSKYGKIGMIIYLLEYRSSF
ncbi:hypothetical protein Goshw_019055 [Gossypium schwendimanii]|uniref:Uncharacterized protein n=1 Tax=Gossypium schwendimanii TaxID=34291 RepID=A0A7J9N5M7_GOSSC|nr:hypothetical protein [Gossypium schwendimanii]